MFEQSQILEIVLPQEQAESCNTTLTTASHARPLPLAIRCYDRVKLVTLIYGLTLEVAFDKLFCYLRQSATLLADSIFLDFFTDKNTHDRCAWDVRTSTNLHQNNLRNLSLICMFISS